MKILEAIKANKAVILKRALIVGGSIIGLLVVSRVLAPCEEVYEDEAVEVEYEPVEENDEVKTEE